VEVTVIDCVAEEIEDVQRNSDFNGQQQSGGRWYQNHRTVGESEAVVIISYSNLKDSISAGIDALKL
jgi:hypothetical protein